MYLYFGGLMVRKSKEDAEKTRQAVLEAALDVFSEKGYAKTTFDEIALRAGFTKGAIYWYFRNKADLLSALIIEYVQRKRNEISANQPQDDSLDGLLNYFKRWADASSRDMRFAKFNRFILCQMEWSEAVIERIDKNLVEIKNFHLEKINQALVKSAAAGELKEGVDIEKVQYIILSTYMGIMFSSLSGRFKYDVTDMVQAGLQLLIDGIRK